MTRRAPAAAARHMATPGTPVVKPGAAPYRLSIALGAVSLASCALSFAVASLLRGAAVEDGSLRGTALVLICVALPLLACVCSSQREDPHRHLSPGWAHSSISPTRLCC